MLVLFMERCNYTDGFRDASFSYDFEKIPNYYLDDCNRFGFALKTSVCEYKVYLKVYMHQPTRNSPKQCSVFEFIMTMTNDHCFLILCTTSSVRLFNGCVTTSTCTGTPQTQLALLFFPMRVDLYLAISLSLFSAVLGHHSSSCLP